MKKTIALITILLVTATTLTHATKSGSNDRLGFRDIMRKLDKLKPPADPKKHVLDLLSKNGCGYILKNRTITYDPISKDPCAVHFNNIIVGPRFFAESKKVQLVYLLHEDGHAAHHDFIKDLCFIGITSYIGSKLLTNALSTCLPTKTPNLVYGIFKPVFWYGSFISTPYVTPYIFAPLFRRHEKAADLYALAHAPTKKLQEAYISAFKHYASYEKRTLVGKIRQFFKDPEHPSNTTRVAYMKKYINHQPYKLSTPTDSDIEKNILLDY